MKQYFSEIDMRCLKLGEYIREKNATVRSAAEKYGISKSTVHTEVTVRNGKKDRKRERMHKKAAYALGTL